MPNEFFEQVPGVPPPIGHSSLAVQARPHVDCAMMLGRVADGSLVTGGIRDEAAQVLRNIRRLLQKVDPDMDLGDLNRTTVFLNNLEDFAAMNAVYGDGEFFGDKGRQPVRAIIQSQLPMGARVGVIAQSHHVGEANKQRLRVLPCVPSPIGPYNRVVVSGNNHIDIAATGPFTADGVQRGTIEDETRLTLDNLEATLSGVRQALRLPRLSLGDIYRLTVCLTDICDFAAMNTVCEERFKGHQFPARATLQQPQIIGGAKMQMIAEAIDPASVDTRVVSAADGAPERMGPYSLAAVFGPHVEFAGQVPCNEQGMLVEGGLDVQIHRVLDNIAAVARAVRGDLSLDQVLRLTVALTDVGNVAQASRVLQERFPRHRPVVSFVHSPTLPRGAEVEGIASMHEDRLMATS